MTRRGFTLIELMVAGMMAVIVLGGITTSLSQLGSAKSVSRQRLEAYSRCDAALKDLRKEVISTLRRGDLFDTRVLITDGTGRFQGDNVNKDELLVFNGNVRANKEIDFNGEGLEYETQFRIEDNDISSALWKRRDAILDDNPVGGGIVTPIADGIISLELEAYDGFSWFPDWDSDELGLPHALRITVKSTGMEYYGELYAPIVTLRTIVPIDRVMMPDDLHVPTEAEGTEGSGDGEGLGGEDGESSGEDNSSEEEDGSGGTGGGGQDGSGGTGGGGQNDKPIIITDPDGNQYEIPSGGGQPKPSGGDSSSIGNGNP